MRREARALWSLHHQLGFGFRRFLGKPSGFEEEVRTIARSATKGVKDIICLQKLTWEDKPGLDGLSLPSTPPPLEKQLSSCSDARRTSRVLRSHISDESTCIGGDISEEEEDAASLADTEEWNSRTQRHHTRKPRKDRRRKARLRREEFEEAKRCAFMETLFEGQGSGDMRDVLGVLECIAERDDEMELDGSGWGVDELGFVSSDNGKEETNNEHQVRNSGCNNFENNEGDSNFELEIGDSGIPNSRKLSSHSFQNDGDCDLDGVAVVAASAAEPAEPLWDHPFFADVVRGAELLPTGLLTAILEYQQLVNEVTPHSIETLEDDVARVGLTIEKIEEKIFDMNSWDCPKYIRAAWMELEQLLMEEEYGPRDRFRCLQDTLEEVNDEDADYETARETWDIDIQIAWSGMEKGCEMILDAMQGIAYARARQEYKEENCDPGKQLAKLGADEVQALLAERLSTSCRGRGPVFA